MFYAFNREVFTDLRLKKIDLKFKKIDFVNLTKFGLNKEYFLRIV